jgi:hypothetical protein
MTILSLNLFLALSLSSNRSPWFQYIHHEYPLSYLFLSLSPQNSDGDCHKAISKISKGLIHKGSVCQQQRQTELQNEWTGLWLKLIYCRNFKPENTWLFCDAQPAFICYSFTHVM